jgi:hypothetical protein
VPTSEAQVQFKIPDSALLSAVCPLCSYSLKELPEARCPECGTRIEPGTVVLVGELVDGYRPSLLTKSRVGDFMIFLGVAVFLSYAVGFIKGFAFSFVVIFGFSALLWCSLALLHWRDLSMGQPVGVVQLSCKGFRRGAGKRAGRLWTWEACYRWEAIRMHEVVQLRCVQFLGPFSLATMVDLLVSLNDQQVTGLKERVECWSQGRTKFKMVGWPARV